MASNIYANRVIIKFGEEGNAPLQFRVVQRSIKITQNQRSFSFNLPVGWNKEYGLNRANLGSMISLSQSGVTYIFWNIVFEGPEQQHVARSLFAAQRALRGPIMVGLTGVDLFVDLSQPSTIQDFQAKLNRRGFAKLP